MCVLVDLVFELHAEDVQSCAKCKVSEFLFVAGYRLINDSIGTEWPCK